MPVILLWSAMAERKIWADMNTGGHIKRINKIKSFIFLWRPNGPSKPLGDIAVGCVSYTHPMRWRIARLGETAKRGKQFTPPVLSHLRKCRRVWLERGDLVFCYELQSDSSACNSLQTHWHSLFIWVLPCWSCIELLRELPGTLCKCLTVTAVIDKVLCMPCTLRLLNIFISICTCIAIQQIFTYNQWKICVKCADFVWAYLFA